MNARPRVVLAISLAGLVAAAAGCEKTDHDNIDKWMTTKKGPGKLKKALGEADLDPDLAAHAAENMIRRNQDGDVMEGFAQMQPERAAAVMAKLAPRLWERARVEGDEVVPQPQQTTAKDSLYKMRKFADEATRAQIDGYLTDWYATAYYDKRATLGAIAGATILRTIGPAAAPRMMQAANAVVAQPEVDGKRLRIGDELMRGLAATGDAGAVKYVLDISGMDRMDDSLSQRALAALYAAYVDPQGLFDVVDPAALAPNIDALVSIAKDDARSSQATNDAVALIRAVGMPACLPALQSLVDHPHRDVRYRYVGANNALRCGGAQAIGGVAQAFPTGGQYHHADLGGAVWLEISRASPRDKVLDELRALTRASSWVARWIAIEGLAAMKSKPDLERIRGLSGDGARLSGYWGEQGDVPARKRKKDPTLGQRAQELAAALAKEP